MPGIEDQLALSYSQPPPESVWVLEGAGSAYKLTISGSIVTQANVTAYLDYGGTGIVKDGADCIWAIATDAPQNFPNYPCLVKFDSDFNFQFSRVTGISRVRDFTGITISNSSNFWVIAQSYYSAKGTGYYPGYVYELDSLGNPIGGFAMPDPSAVGYGDTDIADGGDGCIWLHETTFGFFEAYSKGTGADVSTVGVTEISLDRPLEKNASGNFWLRENGTPGTLLEYQLNPSSAIRSYSFGPPNFDFITEDIYTNPPSIQ